jgi:hypothetical protein
MERKAFIDDLIGLLIRMERRMEAFTEPLPKGVEKGVMEAIVSFGEEALPELHNKLTSLQSQMGFIYLIDILGDIGDESSIPYLIEFHRNHTDFMGGVAAVRAMKKIGTEEVYLYLGNLLIEYLSGKNLFNTQFEITLACEALGDWNDERAIPILEQATTIHNHNLMPETAIKQLAKYEGKRR